MAEYIERSAAIRCCTFGRTSLGLIGELRRLPAADVVEVRHGRWVHHNGGYSDHFECTACGEDIVLTGKWRFCQNCGAKMDGGADDAGTD